MQSKFNIPHPAQEAHRTQIITCRDARTIIRNPVYYHDRPILRRLAWSALMRERGQKVNHARLSKMFAEMKQ